MVLKDHCIAPVPTGQTQLQASCYSSQGLDLLHLWNIPTDCINQDTDGPWYQTHK